MAALKSICRRLSPGPAALALAALACCMAPYGGVEAQPTSLEYAVKANYLYKFAPFLTWPVQSFWGPASPLTICLVGEDPFGGLLDDAVRGQKVDNHPIVVKRIGAVSADMNCQILSIGRSTAQSPASILSALAGQPIVTVTDRSRGIEGGMIQFVMQGGRVRFSIDEAAAKASGITVSSKLLGLALAVNRR